MAKPIVVIYLPENFTFVNSETNAAWELMSILNNDYGFEDKNRKYATTDYWKEYYWFCFPKAKIWEPEFHVFYEKDFTEVQYAELKKIISESIKDISNKK